MGYYLYWCHIQPAFAFSSHYEKKYIPRILLLSLLLAHLARSVCMRAHRRPKLAPRLGALNLFKETNMSILASSLALGSADYTWRFAATCRDTDPELFFPVGTTGQALLQIAKAKSVCCECPVNVDCLEFALETNQDTGIWGGTSEEERRQIRREAAAVARAQRAARMAL